MKPLIITLLYSFTIHCAWQGYGIFFFLWEFLVPLVIFAVAYWKILAVIRRQAKVAARLMKSNEPVAGPSRETVETTNATLSEIENQRDQVVVEGVMMAGQRECGRVGNQQGSTSLSKAQINVVRTMIYITLCFILCWLPLYIVVMYKRSSVRHSQSLLIVNCTLPIVWLLPDLNYTYIRMYVCWTSPISQVYPVSLSSWQQLQILD